MPASTFGSLVVTNVRTRHEETLDLDLRDIWVGRYNECELHFDDPIISDRHLRIYVIDFDCEDNDDVRNIEDVEDRNNDKGPVPPLVYAQNFSGNGTRVERTDYADLTAPRECKLRKGDPPLLLSDGDVLRIGSETKIQYIGRNPRKTRILGLGPQEQAERQAFADRYTVSRRILGHGGFGHVFMAYQAVTQRQVACKIINLLQPDVKLDRIKREYEILRHLKHPNVVQLEKVFIGPTKIYIFQELVPGGDLFSYYMYHSKLKDLPAHKQGCLDEAHTTQVALQIVQGITYLHGEGIAHRDLKLDNILTSSLDVGTRVILTDFGSAIKYMHVDKKRNLKKYRPSRLITQNVGTTEYKAPELFDESRFSGEADMRGYTKEIDLWSIGIITAILLNGENLYPNDPTSSVPSTQDESNAEVCRSKYRQWCEKLSLGIPEINRWTHVSSHARDFVRCLLQKEPKHRMSASEALEHPWLLGNRTYRNVLRESNEKAISQWRPGSAGENIVEELKLTATATPEELQCHLRCVVDLESHYFANGNNTDPEKRKRDEIVDLTGSVAGEPAEERSNAFLRNGQGDHQSNQRNQSQQGLSNMPPHKRPHVTQVRQTKPKMPRANLLFPPSDMYTTDPVSRSATGLIAHGHDPPIASSR